MTESKQTTTKAEALKALDEAFRRLNLTDGLYDWSMQKLTIRRYIEQAGAGWRPIETVPIGKAVLVAYRNELGKSRVIKARQVARFTEEADDPLIEPCEYFAENDTYTIEAGWYEQVDNWDEYGETLVRQTLTHWMPLPAPPEDYQ